MWQTNSASWHDYYNAELNAQLKVALDMGFFALMGTHYHFFGSLNEPGEREKVISFLDWLEGDYPYLHWFKGDELALFWDELGGISDIRQQNYNNFVSVSWSGSSVYGETVIILLQDATKEPAYCYVDDIATEWEKRDDRIFVRLPQLNAGEHTLEVHLTQTSGPVRLKDDWDIRFNKSNSLHIQHLFIDPTKLEVKLFDITGRHFFSGEASVGSGNQICTFQIPSIPSGSVIVRIYDSNEYITEKVVMLR